MLVSLSSDIHFFRLIISANFKIKKNLLSECSNQHLLIKSKKLKMECWMNFELKYDNWT
jgi:hypothetical protein